MKKALIFLLVLLSPALALAQTANSSLTGNVTANNASGVMNVTGVVSPTVNGAYNPANNLTIEGSQGTKIPITVPAPPPVSLPSPSLFLQAKTEQDLFVVANLVFEEAFGPVVDEISDEIGDVKVGFYTTERYQAQAQLSVKGYVISQKMPKGRYIPIGSLELQSTENVTLSHMKVVLGKFLKNRVMVKEGDTVVVVAPRELTTVVSGVMTGGKGASIGLSLANVATNVLSGGVIGISGGTNGGTAMPVGKVALAALVLVRPRNPDDPEAVELPALDLSQYRPQSGNAASESAKKAEAVK